MINSNMESVGFEKALEFLKHLDGDTKRLIKQAGITGALRASKVISEIYQREAFETGRLAASIGTTPATWPRIPIQQVYAEPDEEHYPSPDDGVLDVRWEGNLLVIEYGTNVPYARHIEYGWTSEGPRLVPFRDGGKAWVNTFTKPGVYAFEVGNEYLRTQMNFLIGKALKAAGWNPQERKDLFTFARSGEVDMGEYD